VLTIAQSDVVEGKRTLWKVPVTISESLLEETFTASRCGHTLEWRTRAWEAVAEESRLREDATINSLVGTPQGRYLSICTRRNGEEGEPNQYGFYSVRESSKSV
jgi:hypothetical protein